MSAPLVSILIPCFNAAPWLSATLESALAQTWRPTEIIFVDDGSSDDSLAIAQSFAGRGVRVFSQSNAGASAARNRALREARGDFFQFLDADDLLSPGKITAQMEVLARHAPGTLATCRWGRFENEVAAARFVDDAVFRDFIPLEFLLKHTREAATMHPAAWLVPREVADRAGPWNERLSLNDDGEYFARVVIASTGIAFTRDPSATTFYRSGIVSSLSQRRSVRAIASLVLSVELVTLHLLSAEKSPRTHQALADYWQRLVYELYPDDPAASERAAGRAAEFGGSHLPPPLGSRQRALARVLGWRLVRRLFRSRR